MKVKRTERGWAGHFICADRCLYRRNTLLEAGDIKLVVSTVGNMYLKDANKIDTIGHERYYETMAFMSNPEDMRFHDMDVTKQIHFKSPWEIDRPDADDDADLMHERVVRELSSKLRKGEEIEIYDR